MACHCGQFGDRALGIHGVFVRRAAGWAQSAGYGWGIRKEPVNCIITTLRIGLQSSSISRHYKQVSQSLQNFRSLEKVYSAAQL